MSRPKQSPTCRRCGEALTGADDLRYELHERCEEEYVYCEVCDDFQSDEAGDGCRHVQWVDGVGHTGCGYSHEPDHDLDRLRDCLPVYLRATGCAPALIRALLRRDYWFQYQGFLIGSGWLHFEGGGLWRDYQDHQFLDAVAEDDLPKLQYAVAWLTSLWREDDACRPWELKIAALIQEWLLARPLLTGEVMP